MMEDHLPKIPMMVSSSPTDSSGSGRTDDSRGGKEFQQEGQQINNKAANMGHKNVQSSFSWFLNDRLSSSGLTPLLELRYSTQKPSNLEAPELLPNTVNSVTDNEFLGQ